MTKVDWTRTLGCRLTGTSRDPSLIIPLRRSGVVNPAFCKVRKRASNRPSSRTQARPRQGRRLTQVPNQPSRALPHALEQSGEVPARHHRRQSKGRQRLRRLTTNRIHFGLFAWRFRLDVRRRLPASHRGDGQRSYGGIGKPRDRQRTDREGDRSDMSLQRHCLTGGRHHLSFCVWFRSRECRYSRLGAPRKSGACNVKQLASDQNHFEFTQHNSPPKRLNKNTQLWSHQPHDMPARPPTMLLA